MTVHPEESRATGAGGIKEDHLDEEQKQLNRIATWTNKPLKAENLSPSSNHRFRSLSLQQKQKPQSNAKSNAESINAVYRHCFVCAKQ